MVVNYCFSFKVVVFVYIEDVVVVVVWIFRNIERYGGLKDKIFVSGYLVGGYLISMVGFDKSWLEVYNIDVNDIVGLIFYSGYIIIYFIVRDECGIDGK